MLTPNSRPDRPQPAALAAAEGRRAPPPQSTRSPSRSIAARSPPSLIASPRNPSSATSRFEPDPTTPTAIRSPSAQAQQLDQLGLGSGRANQSAGPPVRTVVRRASGRSRLDTVGRRSRQVPPASASPSRSTSPAPRVTSTVAGPSASSRRGAGEARGAVERRRPRRRRPPIRSAAASATSRPLTPASSPTGSRAPGRRRAPTTTSASASAAPNSLAKRLGPRVEVRLEDARSGAALQLAQGRLAPRGPRSGGGRSRHICGRRRRALSLEAAAHAGEAGERAAAAAESTPAARSRPGRRGR